MPPIYQSGGRQQSPGISAMKPTQSFAFAGRGKRPLKCRHGPQFKASWVWGTISAVFILIVTLVTGQKMHAAAQRGALEANRAPANATALRERSTERHRDPLSASRASIQAAARTAPSSADASPAPPGSEKTVHFWASAWSAVSFQQQNLTPMFWVRHATTPAQAAAAVAEQLESIAA